MRRFHHPCTRRVCALITLIAAATIAAAAQPRFTLLGWNDLGMHCANKDFSRMAVLPPYNVVHAQLILTVSGAPPQIVTTGYHVTYSIPGNTTSAGKTNFWTYAQGLFGLPSPLAQDVGLTGHGLTGTMTPMDGFFEVTGIPVTPYQDTDLVNEQPFQLIHLDAWNDTTDELVASTDNVIPVSNEIGCVQSGCHNSEAGILNEHDSVPGFNPAAPILCAGCHASNALGTTGTAEAASMSYRMHDTHKNVVANPNGIETCYKCHPGPRTQCFRDVMRTGIANPLICQNCHGTLDVIAQSIANGRRPWFDEPRCGNTTCHGATYAEETGKLFRMSKGHGGMWCSACHGSPHAITPTAQPNDNLQSIRLQGYAGPLKKCTICHADTPAGTGPHGTVETTQLPAQPVNTQPPDQSIGVTLDPAFRWQPCQYAATYRLQLSTDPLFGTIAREYNALAQTTASADTLAPSTTYYWRVCGQNAVGDGAWSAAWSFTTGAGLTFAYPLMDSWRMVSLPLGTASGVRAALYPGSTTCGYAYVPAGAYAACETLAFGKGYWMKFPSAGSSVSIIGSPVTAETLDVGAGWNLIGGISTPVAAGTISSDPPGLVLSQFFGWNRGYASADTLFPGYGYWVKSPSPGRLMIQSVPGPLAGRIVINRVGEEPPSAPQTGQGLLLPGRIVLCQNYPNPFNPVTSLRFTVAEPSIVRLGVYNLLGAEVALLLDRVACDPGEKSVRFDAAGLPSGIYYYRLDVEASGRTFSGTGKMTLLR